MVRIVTATDLAIMPKPVDSTLVPFDECELADACHNYTKSVETDVCSTYIGNHDCFTKKAVMRAS